MSNGKIVQVMGPVVDVEFESGDLPEVMTALKTTNPAIDDRADNLTIEVALHLGEKTVRTIAMDTTDGLRRGQDVFNTGAPINIPGTILSQIPRHTAASNISCESATAVDRAITSRLISDSSIPARPWVTPSHMAGTPPATWAVAPSCLAASRICSGYSANG